MKRIIPPKLKRGDTIMVIAPSRSLGIISEDIQEVARTRFDDLGLKVLFSNNVKERDIFDSSSIQSRVNDLHQAFADSNIKAVFSIIGGFNSNQLLKYIDWRIIENNPKIFCGYSDVTILLNAIFQKIGLVTYYGPHYSSFGQKLHFEYMLDYFKKCLMIAESFEVKSSEYWSDDSWYKDQANRNLIKNEGWQILNPGQADGTSVGGNLCTLNLLQGTEFFPDLNNGILFLEEDDLVGGNAAVEFDRNLQSLIQHPQFEQIRGIVIGRFQKLSKMTIEKMKFIIKSKEELKNLPVIAGVDFGHSDPRITFPIGGRVKIFAKGEEAKLEILEH